ncbi:PTS system mannose/fructose/sorbose family transporter subunit IID [Clostridium sp. AL.422]|uniref:PTS system mannose/fructose/sorbose family transporter subunit IID n=1 Tax=Clostridium TaxID=1485 RepID=UPI00293DA81C|nr:MULTISPECIES: PTS system mannose/fructose/sorbose family transporter subunit IID [unclassified Clostridium]MDV4150450.1 PTS system mannose/fructose/sorbose family transporter subunit IID [Clostridium sp. AL.422]
MESRKPVLKQNDYLKTTLRSYFLQNGFNYNSYQGTGYLYVILPALKKIYKNEPEKLKEVAMENIEFYNTNPHVLPFETSMHVAMYDHGESIEDSRSIKMALMGPLAGIGDSIAQFGLAPLFSTIFAGLALDGLTFAPIGFWITMILSLLAIKLVMGHLGYKLGTSIIDTLSEKIGQISHAANIIGVTVISALAVTFVKAKIGIQYTTIIASGEEQIVSIQTILDKILPNMLPAIITIVVFTLVKKYNWSTYKLLALLFALGIVLSYFGILV